MTAIDWLQEKLQIHYNSQGYITLNEIFEYTDKAKEFEKDQIKSAYNAGVIYQNLRSIGASDSQDAEDYYNKSYKQ